MPATIYYNLDSEDFDFMIVPDICVSEELKNTNNVYYGGQTHPINMPQNISSEIKISLDEKSYEWASDWFKSQQSNYKYTTIRYGAFIHGKRDIYLDFGKYGYISRGCLITSLSETEATILSDYHEIVDDSFIRKYDRDIKIDSLLS